MTYMLNPAKPAWQSPGQLFARLGSLSRKGKIEGFVDNIAANEVMGWAWDPHEPNRRIHIVARNDGKIVAEALADLPRGDLASAGKGDGRHGFRLRLPNGLAGLAVTVEAVARPRNQLLQRGQLRVPEQAAIAKPEKVRSAHRFGVIERLRRQQLSGWAVDPKHPESAAQLDVFDGERYLGSAVCGPARPDVGEAGGPPGARGFVFDIPVDGNPIRPEDLRVRIVGSRHDLRRSKSYAETPEEPVPVEEARAPAALPADPDASDVGRSDRDVVQRAAPDEGVAVIICGPEAEGLVGDHQASMTTGPGSAVKPLVLAGRSADEAASALTEALQGRAEVLLLIPGQDLKGQDLQRLFALRPYGDVWLFGARADRAPLFTWQMGSEIRGLAVRASVLRAWPRSAEVLAAGDFAAFAAWSAEQGHRWEALPHDPVAGPSLRPATVGRPTCPPPRRVTLGLWGDWAGSVPLGLAGLLQGCTGLDVEILCPDETLGAAVAALDGPVSGSLDVRIVPTPATPGSGAHLKALAGAANGQVLVLADARLRYARPEGLIDVLTWAMAEGVGCVTVPIETDAADLSGLVLDSLDGHVSVKSGRRPHAPRDCAPVLAAPGEFLVVSRRVLAEMEGVDSARFPDRHADLDLCIRLLERQRHCLATDRLGASLPETAGIETGLGILGVEAAFLLGVSPPCETGAAAVPGRR